MKQRIIKTLIVILFGLILSVKVVAAWTPKKEWIEKYENVSVYDITEDIRGAINNLEGGLKDTFNFGDDAKCYLAISQDKVTTYRSSSTGLEYLNYFALQDMDNSLRDNDFALYGANLFCSGDVKYTNTYIGTHLLESLIMSEKGAAIVIEYTDKIYEERLLKPNTYLWNLNNWGQAYGLLGNIFGENVGNAFVTGRKLKITSSPQGLLTVGLYNAWEELETNDKYMCYGDYPGCSTNSPKFSSFFEDKKITKPLNYRVYEDINVELETDQDASLSCEYTIISPNNNICTLTASLELFTDHYTSKLPFEKVTTTGEDCPTEREKNTNDFIKIESINVVAGDYEGEYIYKDIKISCNPLYTNYREWSASEFYNSEKIEPGGSGTGSKPSQGIPGHGSGGIVSCSDIDVDKIKACGCIPAGVADITSKIYFILRIIGPVLLLILGGFDMAKAVASQDESSIEKAKKKLINKFIAAAAIFFVLTIMEFVVGILAKNAGDILECIHILLDGYVI